MVFYAEAQISLIADGQRLLRLSDHRVRFIHDVNDPKIQIDDFDEVPFFKQFEPRRQRFRFNEASGTLTITQPESPRGPFEMSLSFTAGSATWGQG